MYKSPIEVLYNGAEMQYENGVVSAVQKYGVNVDKDELVRALQYDREQYEKGYADGMAHPKWTLCSERLPEEDENVLVSVHFKGLERQEPGWNDHIKESWYVDIASRLDGNWTSYSDEYKVAKNRHEVIAWMPLPRAYKGEEG